MQPYGVFAHLSADDVADLAHPDTGRVTTVTVEAFHQASRRPSPRTCGP